MCVGVSFIAMVHSTKQSIDSSVVFDLVGVFVLMCVLERVSMLCWCVVNYIERPVCVIYHRI